SVRRKAYWGVFAGGMGTIYGDQDISICYVPGVSTYQETAQYLWTSRFNVPGRTQMQYLRKLLESRPLLGRGPDQSLVTSALGTHLDHIQATRDANNTWAWIYNPDGHTMTIDMSKITGAQVAASWYNPRDGSSTSIGQFPTTGTQNFTGPGTVG